MLASIITIYKMKVMNPDLPDLTELEIGKISIPDNAAHAIVLERYARRNDFKNLRKQIARVGMFGEDRSSEKSFHKLYVDDSKLSVVFEATQLNGVGRCYNVIVNKESSSMDDDGRYLEIEDYLVSEKADLISCERNWLYRSQSSHSWFGINDSHGPIVMNQGGNVSSRSGADYERTIPSSCINSYLEVLWRRDDVNSLNYVLGMLNEVSLEYLAE